MARREPVRSWAQIALPCGRATCEALAVVVLDDIVAATAGVKPGGVELPALCEGHWRELRPASRLDFSGVVAAIPPGVAVEFEPSAAAAVEASGTVGERKVSRGGAVESRPGARRPVGPGRAGDVAGSAAVKPVRLGFWQDAGASGAGTIHGQVRCPHAGPGIQAVRRLTVEEWREARRCACARWFGKEEAPTGAAQVAVEAVSGLVFTHATTGVVVKGARKGRAAR